MSYLKDREIWLSSVPTGNPPAGYVWVFIQNGVFVVRDSSGVDKIMATTTGTVTNATSASYVEYSNVANKPTLISGSSQVSYTGLSNIPAGIVSGSTQVSFNGITDKPTLVSGSSQITYSGISSIPAGIVSSSAQIVGYNVLATTGSNTFQANQTITGSLFITQNLTVAGSSSIQYISSSIVDIADNIITVNAFNPGVRFGGLAVADSGSSPRVSGSMLFDSIKDQWIFIHETPSALTSSVVLMGPETYNDLGNETYLSANRLPKGSGIEHLRDSNITDTGTVVSVNSNTAVTGSFTVVSGSAVELQVTNTGVNIGSISTDNHNVTGSLRVTGSIAVTGAGTFSSNVTANGLNALGSTLNNGNAIRFYRAGLVEMGYIGWSNENANNSTWLFKSSNGNPIGFSADGTNQQFLINTSGNIGIGTTNPLNKLSVISSNSSGYYNRTDAIAVFHGSSPTVLIANDGNATDQYAELKLGNNQTTYYPYSAYIRGVQGAGIDQYRLEFGTSAGSSASTRMTITTSGNVGIGTTSPTTYSLAGRHMELFGGGDYSFFHNNTTTVKSFYAINEASLLAALFTFSSHPLTLGTNNTERMRITSDGYVRLNSSSGGIQFNGDTAAANALDDYEEGSFTPSSLGTTFSSISVTFGRYIKIGNQVTINCKWAVTPGSTGMKYVVFDLPFAFVNNSNISFTGAVSNYNEGLTAGSSNVGTTVRNSSGSTTQQYVEAYYTSTNTSTLSLSMTYFTFF
jgi:hypothetical protein